MDKILYTKDAVLKKEDLMDYIAKFASDNVIKNKSSKDTFPIPRVKENCKYISLIYTLLNEHIKIGIPIHPAGEWILDNFYIIEKAAKTIEKELTIKKYVMLPGILKSGFARIFVLANEIVSNTDGKIVEEDLRDYLKAYQTQKYLNMEEIWNIPIFLQICIIEKIRHICERIFISQMEKYKVDNMIHRIIEKKEGRQLKISVNGAYPFIEYMSYRLKRYGKEGIPYLKAFEEQVSKMGITITDVINREHFDIAIKKLSIKNSIVSMRDISRMNMLDIFKEINIVEKILREDPANVYQKMDYSSKDYYRRKILELAKKTKISEIFIAEEILKICKKKKEKIDKLYKDSSKVNKANKEIELKKAHVGYYLIDDGKGILLSKLLNKKHKGISAERKAKLYVYSIYALTILVTILLFKESKGLSVLLFIPIQNSITKIIQYILGKFIKQRQIPKIDLQGKIPEEYATMVAIPVYLKSAKDVKDIFRKMEVYFLANKSQNLFFTLLGDCSISSMKEEKNDNEIIDMGLKEAKRLNEKYGEIFFFLYRDRNWSESERCYMGWERKRGMINEFNEFLVKGKSKFRVNSLKIENLPKIKYVITIDSDTNLVIGSAEKLIGAMSHILNKPEVDKIKNIVVKGYGIIQPGISLEMNSGRRSLFTRLFAGDFGTDLYSSATYDLYQDAFGEGIFTGKGIYNLEVFYEVLKDSIPENKVLSHDLLEGSFLRCGLANDIILMDGYPSSYSSYKIRKHRWIRGDVQIIDWLNSALNFLSKYKILDNLVRSLNEVFIFSSLILGIITDNAFSIIISFILLGIPMLIELFDFVLNKKSSRSYKMFTPKFTVLQKIIYRYVLDIILLPDTANIETNAFVKAIYRLKFSHLNLLEWTTAKEAENGKKALINDYCKSMIFSIIVGLIFLKYPVSLLWIFSPLIMYLMSKKEDRETEKLSEENEKYLLDLGKKTWNYFKENMTNYLVNDNFQEGKSKAVEKRTSSTNIGLELISIIASYDLGYETKECAIKLLENVINAIEVLPKWNGHLYNWYDTENLTALTPMVVSSVDSGNFVGYLYVLKQFLIEQKDLQKDMKDTINNLLKKVDKLINDADFSYLYDEKAGLFSIGFDAENNKLNETDYDLLASEARQTTLVAIAKKDVESKSWNTLGRTLTALKGHVGLVSWGGTAFEYLMPNIIIPTFESSLLDESCKLMILAQKEYASKLGIPWGISESSFSLKDFSGNYQYKTFGIPWLGLKRGLAEEVVVSPYSTALALTQRPKDAIYNFKRLEKEGALGKYGFFDAIDYTPNKEIIKIFMAHHQGMILASIDNQLKNNIFQKRFMKNPEIEGVKLLLQENVPNNIILTKEIKEKALKLRHKAYDEYITRKTGVNVISTNKYSVITYQNGDEENRLDDLTLTDKNNIYIKDIDSKKIYSLVNAKKDTTFTSFSSDFVMDTGKFKADIKGTIAPDMPVQIREIKLTNKGLDDLNLEVTTSARPILESMKRYNSHIAFENMFLNFKDLGDAIAITRKKREANDLSAYFITSLFEEEGSMEYEIDKEKFASRKDKYIPRAVLKSYPFSKKEGSVINPTIAMRRIVKLKPNETKKLYLISSASYDEEKTKEFFEEYKNAENLERVFELSRIQTEAEIRYLGIKSKQIEVYQKMLKFLLLPDFAERKLDSNAKNLNLDISNEKIWKYGISGDFPILLVNIKDLNDYYVVEEVLKAYEFFRSKNIKIEVAILSKVDLNEEIKNSNMGSFLNKREGIFTLKDLSREEKKVLELRASLIIDAHDGSLKKQIEDLDDSIDTEIFSEDIFLEDSNAKDSYENNIIKEKDLTFFNGYGGFAEDGKEYYIIQDKDNVLPVAWSNVLANRNFGSVVTDSLRWFYMV